MRLICAARSPTFRGDHGPAVRQLTVHPAVREAKRQAETLARYVIEKRGCRWLVYKPARLNPESGRRVFQSEEQAIEYLFNKLPAIESEL